MDPPEDGGDQPDAGSTDLPTPQVTGPATTPLTTVALRGSADGSTRVVIKEEESSLASVNSVYPGGDFCVDDIALMPNTTTSFLVYGVAEDGSISEPAMIDVAQDDGASPPANPTCTDGGECDADESCDNDQDDDCNGFVDECDPGCNGCQDDNLEPNDTPFSVPMVSPGDYPDLKICPCRVDWFAFDQAADTTIDVTVTFQSSMVDIDMKLYTVENAEDRVEMPVASSTTTTGTERINYTVTTGGRYYLKIFSFPEGGDRQGTYKMVID